MCGRQISHVTSSDTKVRGVTLFSCLSKETAEPWRLPSPEFGLKLSSVFTFVVKLLCKWGPPWHRFKELVLYVRLPPGRSFWTSVVRCAYAQRCTKLWAHRGLGKHATLRERWKAACSCLVSPSVFCFFAPQLDWHGLSNNMAGRQYESLPGFYPLKWFSVTFLIFLKGFFSFFPLLSLFNVFVFFSFAPSHASEWFWKANAIHIQMICVAWSQIKIIVLICPFFSPWRWH